MGSPYKRQSTKQEYRDVVHYRSDEDQDMDYSDCSSSSETGEHHQCAHDRGSSSKEYDMEKMRSNQPEEDIPKPWGSDNLSYVARQNQASQCGIYDFGIQTRQRDGCIFPVQQQHMPRWSTPKKNSILRNHDFFPADQEPDISCILPSGETSFPKPFRTETVKQRTPTKRKRLSSTIKRFDGAMKKVLKEDYYEDPTLWPKSKRKKNKLPSSLRRAIATSVMSKIALKRELNSHPMEQFFKSLYSQPFSEVGEKLNIAQETCRFQKVLNLSEGTSYGNEPESAEDVVIGRADKFKSQVVDVIQANVSPLVEAIGYLGLTSPNVETPD